MNHCQRNITRHYANEGLREVESHVTLELERILAVSLMTLNPAELSRQCGEPVAEIYVVIAKHEVLDMEAKTIAELLGVTTQEIETLQQEPLYQKVLMLLKAAQSQSRVNAELGWDALEDIAVSKLLERVPLERDGDFLLKVAAMANRATRRMKPTGHLDPLSAGVRVPLTLTARSVRRLHGNGTQELIEERSVSLNGGHTNPTFADVDALLQVSQRPFMDKQMQIETHGTADPTVDDLMAENW